MTTITPTVPDTYTQDNATDHIDYRYAGWLDIETQADLGVRGGCLDAPDLMPSGGCASSHVFSVQRLVMRQW